jgi:hypothetical protein
MTVTLLPLIRTKVGVKGMLFFLNFNLEFFVLMTKEAR